jgi:hypothetical protein
MNPMGNRERIRAGKRILENAGMQDAVPWLRMAAWARFALTWASALTVLTVATFAVLPDLTR